MRKRKSNFLAGFQRDVRSQTVSMPNEFDLAAQCEHVRSDIDPPAELSGTFNLGTDAAVIEARIKIDNQFDFALCAFDLPNEFVLRPEEALFLFLGSHRHEVGQSNFSRFLGERCFENVRLIQITPRNLRIPPRTNAPPTACFWIDNRPENRRAVETWPA